MSAVLKEAWALQSERIAAEDYLAAKTLVYHANMIIRNANTMVEAGDHPNAIKAKLKRADSLWNAVNRMSRGQGWTPFERVKSTAVAERIFAE